MLVDFWSEPRRIEQARGSCASSIGGSSFFLALNYLFLGELLEAQALLLNGSFMHECVHHSIEEIVALRNDAAAKEMSDDDCNEKLPIYCDALLSTSTRQSMESYLHNALPPEYRRRMSFACQAGKASHNIVGDYINFISSDWYDACSTSPAAARRLTKGASDATVKVVFETEAREKTTMNIGVSSAFRSVFNDYAELRKVSLRSMRFTHAGKILFLSSAGSKTAEQLGIKHRDVIHVSSVSSSPKAAPGSFDATKKSCMKSPSKNPKKRSGRNRRKKKCTTAHAASNAASDSCEQDKIQHSTRLSLVFEEVQPILKSIRQRLNSMNMERTLPKQRRSSGQTKSKAAAAPVRTPLAMGVGGKAGRTLFFLHVGASENLYKTIKPSAQSLSRLRRPIVTDLHGLTKQEAVSKLDRELIRWKDVAMEGSYPFIIPVQVVCGGGGQVLSEVVEDWVRENESVANAPKGCAA